MGDRSGLKRSAKQFKQSLGDLKAVYNEGVRDGRLAGLEEAAAEVEPFTLGQGAHAVGKMLAGRIRGLKEKPNDA